MLALAKAQTKPWFERKLLKMNSKKGSKMRLYNSRFKLFGRGSKRDGAYVVGVRT